MDRLGGSYNEQIWLAKMFSALVLPGLRHTIEHPKTVWDAGAVLTASNVKSKKHQHKDPYAFVCLSVGSCNQASVITYGYAGFFSGHDSALIFTSCADCAHQQGTVTSLPPSRVDVLLHFCGCTFWLGSCTWDFGY
eukprot:123937-Amphidinium_carterae.3